jgi:hypothetical protein
MTNKIDFFIRCRLGGGFVARSYAAGLQAEGNSLAELRRAIRRVVRAKLKVDAPVCLRVGETNEPTIIRLVAAPEGLRAER